MIIVKDKMKNEMKRAYIHLIIWCFLNNPGFAATTAEPLERATVKTETVTVYSEMLIKSEIVKTLKKGDVVRIEMEMLGSEGNWCRITEEGQIMSIGFLLCEHLDRPEQRLELVGLSIIETLPVETIPGELLVKPVKVTQADIDRFVNAARGGKIAVVKAIIEKGVDVNAKDSRGVTAIAGAAYNYELEILKLLIEMGADVNARVSPSDLVGESYVNHIWRSLWRVEKQHGVKEYWVTTLGRSKLTTLSLIKRTMAIWTDAIEGERMIYIDCLKLGYMKCGTKVKLLEDHEAIKERVLAKYREVERLLIEAGAKE